MTPCLHAQDATPERAPTWLAPARSTSLKLSSATLTALMALMALMAMLIGTPAYATDYTFPAAGPNTLPPGCSQNAIAGSYACGALTLADDDTITIAGSKPATITFSAALTTGANTKINAAGSAADLNIITSAAITIGANAILNANVNASAAVTSGAGSAIGGNIVTTMATGVVTIGDNSTVGGYLETDLGAATVGAASSINGAITTQAGVVAVGAGSRVNGAINTAAGGITTSANVTVNGSISAQAGVIVIGAGNNILGKVSTVDGAITVGAGSSVGAIQTLAGVVALKSEVTVNGDISSGAGAVTVGDYSRLCGKIVVRGAGVVALTTNVKVGGGISTTAGGITVGAGSTIGGNVTVTGAGVVALTQVLVGGSVSTTAGAITMTASQTRGSVAASGAGVVTLTASTQNDQSFTIAAACAPAVVTPPATATTAATAASFDALETGVNAPWSATARKPVYTKLVGTPFTFDIAALKTDGMLESAYVGAGGASRYVKLELFDDTGAPCSNYGGSVGGGIGGGVGGGLGSNLGSSFGGAVATQTLAFTTTFSTASGRALGGPFTLGSVHKALLVRITECVDGSCSSFSGTPPACSSDRFAVRPSAVTLSTTTAMAAPPSPTASQVIRAGANFTLLAKTGTIDAYGGMLMQDTGKLSAQSPAEGSVAQSGGAVGVLTPSTLTANGSAALANYSEVGYLYIGVGAYRDDNFTAIDSAVGDCLTSTINNAYLSDTLIDGKYGCSIGNKAIASLGRFVPDHFSTAVVPGSTMPCPFVLVCPPAGFVYSGQPFALAITALSADGTPTLNYTGLLARDVTLSAWDAAGSSTTANPAGGVLGTIAVSAATFVNGIAIAKPAYTFPTRYRVSAPITLAAPTDIYLRAIETGGNVTSTDVSSLRFVPLVSLEGGIKIVSGRIKVENTYGSELLAVPVVTRVQYWDGFRFTGSATDAKTRFSAADIVRSDCKLRDKGKALVADPACTIAPADNTTPPPVYVMVNGTVQFRQAVPGAGYSGSADLSINSITSPWLPSTKARIGVGVYKGGPVIYRREMY